jgi:hypothetical protein
MSLSSFILASSSGDRTSSSKGDVRRENELLCAELESLQRELKKLKQVTEQLTRDYEESKDFDPLRRYEKLKGMIKRTILHLKLNPDDQMNVHVQGKPAGVGGLMQGCREYAMQVEGAKRREEKYARK